MYMYKNCISWCIYKRNEIEKANVKYIFRGCHGLSRLFFKKKISSLECPFPSLSFDQYTTTSRTLVYLQRIVNVEWTKEKARKGPDFGLALLFSVYCRQIFIRKIYQQNQKTPLLHCSKISSIPILL